MQQRRYRDIIALKTPAGRYLAFHARKLEVAEISPEAWTALGACDAQSSSTEVLTELGDWEAEESSKVAGPNLVAAEYIRSLSINVTQVCNLHCVYCAAGGDGTYGAPTKKISVEKTLPQLKWFLDKTPPGGMLNINFLGGEPLLYPSAISMLGEYAKELAKPKNITVNFNLVTNGTLFSESSIKELKKIGCAITLSLDGPPEINDQVRPGLNGKGVTAQILEGLKLLLENRNGLGTIGVQAVFGKHNTQVLKAYQFFRELNLNWYEFNYDQTNSDPASSYTFETELISAGELAIQHGGEPELRKIKFYDQIFNFLDSQKGLNNYCGAGRSYVVIDSQNRVFTCPWEVNESSRAVGQGTDLNLKNMQYLEKTQLEANNCGDCWARHLCGGGCMYAHEKTTGSKHRPDPLYCNRTRNLISTAIMHYESIRRT